MKKAVCLALILCILTSITSCTGYKKLSEIKATDYFSGIECSIPLSIPSGAMTSEFLHTDDDIDEIKARLDKISSKEGSFTVQYLPYNALLIGKRQTGPHMNDTIINKNGWKSFVNR